jgi:LmbE family N-acetylglucosaminyl deacetylase
MKIVIFAPHPDDELVGAGGSILKWMDEGHKVEIVYISDGRAAYTFEKRMGRLMETNETQISQDDLAGIRMREIDKVISFLGIPEENIHKFQLPDQQVMDFRETGIEMCKPIIKDADRIVAPSNNNPHTDHQATFNISTTAAKELGIPDVEFYIYAVYLSIKAPREKQIKIDISDYNQKIYQALQLYKSQTVITTVQASFERMKKKKWERFGVFKLDDLGKYHNF